MKEGAYDFVWFGQKGVGCDESLVGPMVAEILGLPHVGNIVKLELGDGKVVADREIEGAHELVECTLPARADRAEGPERAALRVAQGHHGGEEEADRDKKLSARRAEADPRSSPEDSAPRNRAASRAGRRSKARGGRGGDPAAAGRARAAAARRSEGDLTP